MPVLFMDFLKSRTFDKEPDRALPVVSILYILILFLHPQVSVYLMAGAMAAVVIGWRRPDIRARMRNLGIDWNRYRRRPTRAISRPGR